MHSVVFYSTPHSGADLAQLGRRALRPSPVLDVLRPFNGEASKLNGSWTGRVQKRMPQMRVKQLHETCDVAAFGLVSGWQGVSTEPSSCTAFNQGRLHRY